MLDSCEICGKKLTNRGFSFHVSQSHGIKIEDYIIKYIYNGIDPKCMCGCGECVRIRGYQVMDYVDYHSDRGRFTSESSQKRDHEKWLKNTTEGIRKYNKEQKENNPNYRSGKNNNFYGKSPSKETRDKIRVSVKKQISDGKHPFIGNYNGRIRGSKLEDKFENFLLRLGIPFEHNFKIKFEKNEKIGYRYYDFYIKNTKMLIEIHGNYWHPRHEENLNEIQKKNIENDQFKKELAEKNGYKVIYIYEDELDDFIERKDIDKLVVEYGS